MKKIICIALSLLLVLCLTACGQSPGQSTDSKQTSSTEGTKALDYPNRTVEFIVPFAAGGGTDIMGRAIAAELPFTTSVINMEGGNSSIGTMEALHRDPDGYTILVSLPNSIVNHSTNGVFPEPANELLIPLGCPVEDPIIICINAHNDKFKDWDSLKAYLLEHPTEVKWGASGNKSGNHGACVKTANLMGVKTITYVPFDGTAKARTAILGNNIDVVCGSISELGAYIASGDLTCIVTMAPSRCSFVPDTPSFAELGGSPPPVPTRGFFAPPGTPDDIVKYLVGVIKEVSLKPEVQEKMRTLFYDPVYTDPETVAKGMIEYLDYLADFPKLFSQE